MKQIVCSVAAAVLMASVGPISYAASPSHLDQPTAKSIVDAAHLNTLPAVPHDLTKDLNLTNIMAHYNASVSPKNSSYAVGSLPGKVDVTPTGSLNYVIPIEVAPGTNGMTPNLKITYNSQQSNGLLGMGFSLQGLTAITRAPQNQVQNGKIHGVDYTNEDRFSWNGEQLSLIPGHGTYGGDRAEYRTYGDTQAKIMSFGHAGNGPETFKVWTKNGQIGTYGFFPDSRVLTSDNATIASWGLSKLEDSSGNFLYVRYNDDINGFFPTEIDYTYNYRTQTKNSNQELYNKVRFYYEDRPDIQETWHAGTKSVLKKRIKAIQIYVKDQLAWYYRFDYEQSPNTGRSRISQIQKCDNNGYCMAPTKFDWQTNEEGWEYAPQYIANIPPLVYDYTFKPGILMITHAHGGVESLDLTGNGLSDLLISRKFLSYDAFHHVHSESVQQTYINNGHGFDENNQYAPPTLFETNGTHHAPLPGQTDMVYLDQGVRFLDLNGNGLFDIIQATGLSDTPCNRGAWLNSGQNWQPDPRYWNVPEEFTEKTEGLDEGTRIVDINGNGLDDLIISRASGSNPTQFIANEAWINMGDHFAANPGYRLPNAMASEYFKDLGTRFIDLNGDGLPNLISSRASGSDVTHFVYNESWSHTGDHWEVSAKYRLPNAIVTEDFKDLGTRFIDLNGDGLPDLISSRASDSNPTQFIYNEAWANTGNYWEVIPSYRLPVAIVTEYFQDIGTRFVDLNGDGIPDIVSSRGNSAGGFIYNESWVRINGQWIVKPNYRLPAAIVNENYADNGFQFMDLNGNGLMDIVFNNSINKGAWLNKAKKLPDYLIGITDGLDSKTTIDYEPLTHNDIYTKEHDASYPNWDYQGPMYVVASTHTQNTSNDYQTLRANGGDHATLYHYTGAKMNHLGWGFLGFHKIAITDATTGIKVETTYSQDTNQPALLHRPLSSKTYTADGTLIAQTDNTWFAKNWGTGTPNVNWYQTYLSKIVTTKYSLTGTLLSTETKTIQEDTYDNPIHITDIIKDAYGEYATGINNTYVNHDGSYDAPWILGLLTASTVAKSVPYVLELSRTSHFEYDDLGRLTKTITEPNNPALSLTTTLERDVYGHVIKTTITGQGIEPRTTSAQYDDLGRFVIAQTNALGETVHQTYSEYFGKPLSMTDPNGLTTIYNYDSFGRLFKTTYPDGTTSTVQYNWYAPTTANEAQAEQLTNVCYTITTQHTAAPPVTQYYDNLNREVAKSTIGFNGYTIWQTTQYDVLGRPIQKSLPYFEGAQPRITRLDYDVLGRLVESTNPDGSLVITRYEGAQTTIINRLAQQTTKTSNALGQVIEVKDNAGNVTHYDYDSYGNLITLKDSAGNVSSLSYDNLGRKIAMSDPDKGHWAYAYNVLGELTNQTDAKGQTTTMSYDKLGRLIARTDPAGTSSWTYGADPAKHNVGQLIAENGVSNARGGKANALELVQAEKNGLINYQKTFEYDELGRLQYAHTTINDSPYTITNTYDSNGRLDTATYPSGMKVKNEYTSLGFLKRQYNPNNNQTYTQIDAMDAKGRITASTTGNGYTTYHTYDYTTGFLTDITTKPSTALGLQRTLLLPSRNKGIRNDIIQSLHYEYDSLGNVLKKTDGLTGKIDTYRYDNLNRLTQWLSQTSTQTKNIDYAYDATGNITYKSDVGTYHYGNQAGPHAVTSITDASGKQIGLFKYDQNGDQTHRELNGTTQDITYTTFNKPLQINTPKGTVNYYYNADRTRFMRLDQTKTYSTRTYFLDGVEIQVHTQNGITQTQEKDYLGDNVLYIKDDLGKATTNYLSRDNLGSVDAITDESGQILARYAYTPFGEQTQTKGDVLVPPITYQGFTGHEEIPLAGLIHTNGRLYDPHLGRFLSADPSIQAPYNSQSLNRYSYCVNNPLAFTDPTGYSWLGDLIDDISDFFHKVGDAIKQVFSNRYFIMAIGIAISALCMHFEVAWYLAALYSSAFEGASTLINGGGMNAAIQAAGMTFLTAAAFHGAGEFLNETPEAIAKGLSKAPWAERTLVHGLVGGGIQVIEGGDFKNGFLAAAISEAVPINQIGSDPHDIMTIAERTSAAAVVGGTVAATTGGDFVDGAQTAAFAELFNDTLHPPHAESPKITKEDLSGKTPAELRQLAKEKGLKPFGEKDNPMYPKKWKDPVTNKERLRIDEAGHRNKITGEPYDNPPSAGKPHVHGYDEDGTPIRDASGDKHFPLGSILSDSAVSVLSRVAVGVGLLLYSEKAY